MRANRRSVIWGAAIAAALVVAVVAVLALRTDDGASDRSEFEAVRSLSLERDLAFVPRSCCDLDYVETGLDTACSDRSRSDWAALLRATADSQAWGVEEQAAIYATLIDVGCPDARPDLEAAAASLDIELPAL